MPNPPTDSIVLAPDDEFLPQENKRLAWLGLMGMPLAFVALPLYVHLPHVYANRYGMSLSTLGMVLLLARVLDAVTDPWLAQFSDRLYAHSPHKVLRAAVICSLGLILGMVLIFFPPWSPPDSPFALLATLIWIGLALSLLTISHQAWSARLGGHDQQRTRIVAWREAAALCGVVMASVLPSLVNWEMWLGIFAFFLMFACWAWHYSCKTNTSSNSTQRPTQTTSTTQTQSVIPAWRNEWLHLWNHAPFRHLMLVFVINGLASAMLARLIAQRGDRGHLEGVYFGWWNLATKLNLALSAGLALPLLEWLGYTPGNSSSQGKLALSTAYAVVPCVLKSLAAALLYALFLRHPISARLNP